MPTIAPDENATALIDWQQCDLYRFFAFVFAPPTRECFDLLAQPGVAEAMRNLWERLACESEFPGFEWFVSYQQYEFIYIALFDVGLPEPPAPLFESAHDKTHPAQEIALENTYFYEVLGLKSDPSRGVPDYLVTQLEFLAALHYTSDNTSDEATAVALARAETDFIQRHLLNWLPTAEAKLDRIGAPGFPLVMSLLLQFVGERHQSKMRHRGSR